MPELNREHFRKLVECCKGLLVTPSEERISAWVGKSTRAWLEGVTKGQGAALFYVDPSNYSSVPFDRRKLAKKIAQSGSRVSDEALRDLVVDILAWGGMSAKNARYALPRWDDWKAPCRALLQGSDAVEAYDQFYRLHNAEKIKGMGPAYYTKLIHFLGKGDGLIMDQWTSRSINLLFGENIISLDHNNYVHKRNNYKVYENYIESVSNIAIKLSEKLAEPIKPSRAEEYLFSFTTDKRKKGNLGDNEHKAHSAWRSYVQANNWL